MPHGTPAAHGIYEMQATRSFGIITQVGRETFIEIIGRQDKPLILESTGGIFRKHYRYLTSYKGITFFTKCYNAVNLPTNAEIIKVHNIRIPEEGFKIY